MQTINHFITISMEASPSPLTPRDVNRSTPAASERKTSHKILEATDRLIFQDTENVPLHECDGLQSPSITDTFSSPTKSDSPNKQTSPRKRPGNHQTIALTEAALRENEGLTRAIKILEDESSGSEVHNVDNDTVSTIEAPQGYAGMDDTGFTTFSAVPNADMTLFAQIGQSPVRSEFSSPFKSSRQAQTRERTTPQHIGQTTPVTARNRHFDECSPSPTPRRPKSSYEEDSTNLILDFTEQFSAFTQGSNQLSSKSSRLSPRKFNTQPNLASFAAGRRTPSPTKPGYRPTTPSGPRQFANLLDFDLTPAPTPRSIPSITARELESLKSNFLSQISSLRAALSGKEAEVNSLKEAVESAERRVGEALEEIREERGTRESLQVEKVEWEKRDKEMQGVLRNVKEEIIHGDRERDQLQQKLDDNERKREEAELKIIEAQSKSSGLEAGSAAMATTSVQDTPVANSANSSTIEAAVEKVAKELHGLYRHKHEVKVAALKESYRARWERKIHDLEAQIEQVSRENEDLRLGRDATMSGVIPGTSPLHESSVANHNEQLEQQRAEQEQRADEQAKVAAAVQEQMAVVKRTNADLLAQLEKERREMADLVAATEEMMQLSLNPPSSASAAIDSSSFAHHPLSASGSNSSSIDNLRGSISRPAIGSVSGLKPPSFGGAGESRIGRGRMGGTGEMRARGGVGGRSGIMGNIERMGRGGRVGEGV